jgi:hypothetical protein
MMVKRDEKNGFVICLMHLPRTVKFGPSTTRYLISAERSVVPEIRSVCSARSERTALFTETDRLIKVEHSNRMQALLYHQAHGLNMFNMFAA